MPESNVAFIKMQWKTLLAFAQPTPGDRAEAAAELAEFFEQEVLRAEAQAG